MLESGGIGLGVSPKRGLLGQAATVGVGAAIAQMVPLAATPLLTRMYGPEDFGAYGLFFSITMTVSIVASGRYELAIPSSVDDDEAGQFLAASVALLTATSLTSAIVFSVLWMFAPGVLPLWVVVLGPASVFGSGLLQSLSMWFTRFEDYWSVVKARIVVALGMAAGSLALGVFMPTAVGLAAGAASGHIAGSLVAVLFARKSVARAWSWGGWSSLWRLMATHKQYPGTNALHALVDGLRESGLQAGLALLFGVVVNGQYGIASKVTRAPASLLGSALSQVLFGRLARDRRLGKGSRHLIVRGSILLGLALCPFFLALMLAGSEIFTFLLGAEWSTAGQYAAIMAPGLWANFVVAPFATMPIVTGRLSTALRFALVDLGARGVALLIGAVNGSAEVGLGLMSASSVVLSAVLLHWYLGLASGTDERTVVFLGQRRWSEVLAQALTVSEAPDSQSRFVAVPLERLGDLLSLTNLVWLLRGRVLVRVGFRPCGQTRNARRFELLWRAVRAINAQASVVMYWLGTDVMRTRAMLEAGTNVDAFERAAANMTHIAASENLVAELRTVGVRAKTIGVPGLTLTVPDVPPAFPDQFTVVTYIPDARHEFYGSAAILHIAERVPEVRILVMGGLGLWLDQRPGNVEFLGWVDDASSVYSRGTVVVRSVAHDAVGGTAIEGLLLGRPVIYSGHLADTIHVAFGDALALENEILDLLNQWKAGTLVPDVKSARNAMNEFSQSARVARLRALLEEMC